VLLQTAAEDKKRIYVFLVVAIVLPEIIAFLAAAFPRFLPSTFESVANTVRDSCWEEAPPRIWPVCGTI